MPKPFFGTLPCRQTLILPNLSLAKLGIAFAQVNRFSLTTLEVS
jgi:hypothetical protein